jgi:DNA-binding transcriptional LysR family regulator
LREFERVRSDLDDVRGLKRGNVKIALVEGVVSNFLFSIVAKFGEQFPNVTFDVDVAGTGEILNSVAQDDADLGIAFNPVPHPDVETHVEVRHPIVAITPPNHPLANRGNVGLGDLRGYKVGMLHSSFGARKVLDRALLEENVRLDALLTINSLEMHNICDRLTQHHTTESPGQALGLSRSHPMASVSEQDLGEERG